MTTVRYVLEMPFFGTGNIRPLTESEEKILDESKISQFRFWRVDGGYRFWDATQISFNNKSGPVVYPGVEHGFKQADFLVQRYGSFIIFYRDYIDGYEEDFKIHSPATDFVALLPPYFVNLIAGNGLILLAVISDVETFLGHYEDANGYGWEELFETAKDMGLM